MISTSNLLARHYSIKSAVNLKFTYDNRITDNVTVRVGDEVTVYYNKNSKMCRANGIIVDIVNKKDDGIASSFRSNEQVGNGGYDLMFKIDISTTKYPDILDLYLIDILSMSLGEDFEEEDPYPSIPYREPTTDVTDPVDPEVKYNISITSNTGLITNLESSKNDNFTTKIEYPDHTIRLGSITIDDVKYEYDKTTGTFTPELPTNIGFVEDLPKVTSLASVYATIIESGEDYDIDMIDVETGDTLDVITRMYIGGSITITILAVQKDYNINVKFIDNIF